MKTNIGENERAKLAVYESVMYLLMANKRILNIHALTQANARLNRLIGQIRQADRTLYSNTLVSEITSYKAKDDLVAAVLPVSAALLKYANSISNRELKSISALTQESLLKLPERELLESCVNIKLAAAANISALRKYKTSIRTLQNLSERIEEFKSSFLNKLNVMLSINTYFAIKELYCEADKILDQIDSFVESLDEEYSDFYDEYLHARETEFNDLIES